MALQLQFFISFIISRASWCCTLKVRHWYRVRPKVPQHLEVRSALYLVPVCSHRHLHSGLQGQSYWESHGLCAGSGDSFSLSTDCAACREMPLRLEAEQEHITAAYLTGFPAGACLAFLADHKQRNEHVQVHLTGCLYVLMVKHSVVGCIDSLA